MKDERTEFEAWYASRHETNDTTFVYYTPENRYRRPSVDESWSAYQAGRAALHSPEVQAWERDAERYRWLRSCSGDAHWSCYEKDGYGGLMLKSEESLDKAIDAAMQEKTV